MTEICRHPSSTMPILRNQAKAGPLHAGVPGEVFIGVSRRPLVQVSCVVHRCGKSIVRSDRFWPTSDAARSGPRPKHFCCGKWREMTSGILTK